MPYLISRLNSSQETFLKAADALGATSPTAARDLSELPTLTSAELDRLVNSGIVREAADRKYYVFQPPSWRARRVWRVLLFWLLILLIPVILIQLTNRR